MGNTQQTPIVPACETHRILRERRLALVKLLVVSRVQSLGVLSPGVATMRVSTLVVLLGIAAGSGPLDAPPASPTPREALQPFGDLIGTWRGTGTPVVPLG